MLYVSTRGETSAQDFSQILLAGSAPDGGLYMPQIWPRFTKREIADFKDKIFSEVAFAVMRRFCGKVFGDEFLSAACREAYAGFHHPEICPIRQISPDQFLLELFHGPTFSFKDIAMQLMARLVGHQLEQRNERATVICATSGDTGGAAVEAFRSIPAVDTVVLFPKDRISEIQRRQMTTSGARNVFPFAVEGSFDDAQKIVKALFADRSFCRRLHLTAVNSINWARIAAQVTYYFTAGVRLGAPEREISFSVPTGNFGDIFAGYVAMKMGLPVKRLVIATNENDILARALATGRYETREVKVTSSPSMDIQVSSNFERLLFEACGRDPALVRELMDQLKKNGSFAIPKTALDYIRTFFSAASASEEEVFAMIREMREQSNIIVDPHTAVALVAARKAWKEEGPLAVLATAHPAKFASAILRSCGGEPEFPPELQEITRKNENFPVLKPDLSLVKTFIEKSVAHRLPT